MLALLDLSPSGIDEIMALTQLIDYLDYDIIIIDSAPTGHFIRLLELPALINQWLKVIFEILLKYKSVLSLPSITLKLVKLSKNIKKLQKLLQEPTSTQISVVSLPTQLAFEETRDLVGACQRWLPVSRLFLNRFTLQDGDWRQRYQQVFPDLPQTMIYTGQPPGGIETLSWLGEQLYE
jgi:arsenite-transporting ATPase